MTPEEFQKQLQDMMKRFGVNGPVPPFGETPGGASAGAGASAAAPPEKEEEERNLLEELAFGLKPRDVKDHLDKWVIRQDEAKKVLSVALCDHYNHVHRVLEAEQKGEDTVHFSRTYTKQNILLLGPTGVGKTYLIRSLAELIGVPFVKADATKFSETGYVGADAEDLVRDLVRQADGDIEKAQYGIIYIDEIDKIAGAGESMGRDVSGRGVQTNLLKLMEETDVPTRSPNDISGQFQMLMNMTRGSGGKTRNTINTRNILFVVSGAFEGLTRIISQRRTTGSIGFAPTQSEMEDVDEDYNTLRHVTTADLVKYGYEPEFVGRLPVRVICHQLRPADLYQILKFSAGSILNQYRDSFRAYGIETSFDDEALMAIATQAAEEMTGARGLMTVCERVFRGFKYELPSTSLKNLEVTADLVADPAAALSTVLDSVQDEEEIRQQQSMKDFLTQFKDEHGLQLVLAPDARSFLINQARARELDVRRLCEERFHDVHFGLQLVSRNTGRKVFELGLEDVANLEKVLSRWVVESYQNSEDAAEGDK